LGVEEQHADPSTDRHPIPGRIITPLMRLQDRLYTHAILVTLPEITPVSEAAVLQEDLRRAKIEPLPGSSTGAF
jgi:arsenite/tail-anchored protein-transporting ATPase